MSGLAPLVSDRTADIEGGLLRANSGRFPARFRGEIHSAAEGPPFEGRAPQNSARARQPRPVTSGDDGTDTVASSTRPADVG